MNSRSALAFVLLALPLTQVHAADAESCRRYIEKFPALSAAFTIKEGMKLKNTSSYNYRRAAEVETFTLKKKLAKNAGQPEIMPWPLRTSPAPSIKEVKVKRAPDGRIEEITDGRVHMTFQTDDSGQCLPDAIFDSKTGEKEKATLFASAQFCGSLSRYLDSQPQFKPCVQGSPSVIDATLAHHEENLKAFLDANPKLNACFGSTPASGVALEKLLRQNAKPFANVDGLRIGKKEPTLPQSLEDAHALWKSCERLALNEFIDDVKPTAPAPGPDSSSKKNKASQ